MIRNGIKSLIFILICAGGLAFLNRLLPPTRRVEVAVDNYHSEHVGVYELEHNTVDVGYIGSSHVFSSISPEDIYKQFGITGYVLGSSCQKIWQSYYYLKELLNTQKPRVVILDTFMALDWGEQSEPFNREAIDCMKLSPAKIESILTAEKMNPVEEDFASYFFPVMRYHDRWSELTMEDYKFFYTGSNSPTKGFLSRRGNLEVEFNYGDYQDKDIETPEINPLCADYLMKIKQLCEENGIDFILVKFPTCLWNYSNSKAIQKWANQHDVLFMDFNADESLRGQINIDWSVDSLDGGNHLNYDGAMKMSEWMGKWLVENYHFDDKRKLENYRVWDDDYCYYKQCLLNEDLKVMRDFAGYIETLGKHDYVTLVTTNGIDMSSWQDGMEKLKSLGITEVYLNNTLSKANYTVVREGRCLLECVDDRIVTLNDTIDEFGVCFKCYLDADVQHCTCIVDRKELAIDTPGLQFIVFDPITRKYVDTSVWLVGEDGSFSRT